MQFLTFQTCPETWKIGMHFSFNIPVTMQFQKFCRPAQRHSHCPSSWPWPGWGWGPTPGTAAAGSTGTTRGAAAGTTPDRPGPDRRGRDRTNNRRTWDREIEI